MDSRQLLSACDRVTRVVTQVCNDSKTLYGKSYDVIESAISQLEDCIKMLEHRVGKDNQLPDCENSITDQQIDSRIKAVLSSMDGEGSAKDTDLPTEPSLEESKRKHLSTNNQNKQETYKYGNIFNRLPDNLNDFPEIKKLAVTLNSWFSTVVTRSSRDRPVKFKRSRIHEWVENIVIGYGKYRRLNQVDSFMSIMNNWLNEDNNTYIIPGEIYRFSKSLKDEDMTVDALVIWDILFDRGLNQFMQVSNKSGFNSLALRSRFETSSSDFYELFSQYKKYKSDPSILKELKISCQEVI